jgi:hypothetical protein
MAETSISFFLLIVKRANRTTPCSEKAKENGINKSEGAAHEATRERTGLARSRRKQAVDALIAAP